MLTGLALAQVPVQFESLTVNPPDRAGLIGNGITDLLFRDSTIYAATGYGLNISRDKGVTWQQFTPAQYGGKGGLSALAVGDDGTLWIATGYDTTVQDNQSLSAGGGLRYRLPGSEEWHYIPQPKDAVTDTAGGMSPTTTHVQNITFDIALLDTQVWIASFGGGLRRSLDMGQTWQVVTTDGKPFSSLKHLNHRAFSVMTENGNVWVGSAGGISVSRDGGETWVYFTIKNNDPQPGQFSGNWVIALAHNPWDNSVWAVTLTTGGNEYNAVCRTLDGGHTWKTTLVKELSDGTFARAIAFKDSAIYVATEKGVYKSIDDGDTWLKFPRITDAVSGESILTEKFYSVATQPLSGVQHGLWVGSADGLAFTDNNGFDWTVFRSFVSTRVRTEPAAYAYPSPFSPERGGVIRFQYDIKEGGPVTIDIYNFAMEKVITIRENESTPTQNTYDRSAHWDGRDSNGRYVDNGVYFFRVKVGGKVTWGKFVVIN
ncbi:MAG: FlgD immunoglobulin-like domain containing protein [Calditrichia bacterium]